MIPYWTFYLPSLYRLINLATTPKNYQELVTFQFLKFCNSFTFVPFHSNVRLVAISQTWQLPQDFWAGVYRQKRERDNPGKFSVLVCLPAGMWALSLRPPEPWRRRERTNACAIPRPRNTANTETGEPVIKETVAAVPGQLSSRLEIDRAPIPRSLISHLGQCLPNKRGFRSQISPVVS